MNEKNCLSGKITRLKGRHLILSVRHFPSALKAGRLHVQFGNFSISSIGISLENNEIGFLLPRNLETLEGTSFDDVTCTRKNRVRSVPLDISLAFSDAGVSISDLPPEELNYVISLLAECKNKELRSTRLELIVSSAHRDSKTI